MPSSGTLKEVTRLTSDLDPTLVNKNKTQLSETSFTRDLKTYPISFHESIKCHVAFVGGDEACPKALKGNLALLLELEIIMSCVRYFEH